MSTDCKPAIPPNIYWMVSTFWSLNAESPPEHGYMDLGLDMDIDGRIHGTGYE